MYGKLINGNLKIAPNHITVGANNVWNANTEMMRAQGWKPVVFSEPPEAPTGYYYASGWEEQTDAIVQTWTLTEPPDDIDDSEAIDIILGGAE